jgi:hypothetical protein
MIAGGLARVNDLTNGASAVWRDGRQEVSMIGNGWLQIAWRTGFPGPRRRARDDRRLIRNRPRAL